MKRKIATYVALLCLACAPGLWAQQATNTQNDNAQLRQEVEQLKKTLATLEQRLSAQEKKIEPSRSVARLQSPNRHPPLLSYGPRSRNWTNVSRRLNCTPHSIV